MGKATIIEAQNSNTIYEEGKSSGILGKLKGIFADYKNGTRNSDRLYSEELWDNRVFGSEDVMEALETKTLFGELDHPEGDRCETLAKNAAISITKLEKRPEEGVIYGEAEILDTPTGRIVKALADSGAKLGISSRGMGEEIYCEGRNIIDPETYDFITFDVVVTPANTKARVALTESKHLDVLTESLAKEIKESETVNQLNQMKTVLENMASDKKEDLLNLVETKIEKLTPAKTNKLSESNKQIALNLLKKKFVEQQETISTLETKTNKLEEENNFYKESRNNMKTKLKESSQTMIENKTELTEKDKVIENLQQQLTEKDTQIKTLTESNEKQDIRYKENQLKAIQLNNKKVETVEQQYKEQLEKLQEELSKKTEMISALETTNKELTENLKVQSKILSENKSLIAKVESLEKEKTASVTKLQENKTVQTNKIKELEAKIAELEEKTKYTETIEERYAQLPFSPVSTVKAIKENYDTTSQYSQEEIELFNILTGK